MCSLAPIHNCNTFTLPKISIHQYDLLGAIANRSAGPSNDASTVASSRFSFQHPGKCRERVKKECSRNRTGDGMMFCSGNFLANGVMR